MAYTTVARVQSEFKDVTFSSTTSIKDTAVSDFIDEADALINARLGLVYSVPVTGTESLKLLRMISTHLVKERLEKILQVKTGDSETSQEGAENKVDPHQLLADLVSGKAKLSDSTKLSSGDGVSSYGYDNDLTATMDKGSTQW